MLASRESGLHLLWRLVLVGGIPIKGEEKPFSTRHAALPFRLKILIFASERE
jgi:hypothetical protein